MFIIIVLCIICAFLCKNVITIDNSVRNIEGMEDFQYWNDLGRKELEQALKFSKNINTNVAKNIILFIGDGMSLPTSTAARLF